MYTLEKLKTERVVLYGAGIMGLGIANVLKDFGVNPICFCDNKKAGIEPRTGLPIISPQRLYNEHANAIIVISTPIYAYQIEQDLKRLGFSENNILSDFEYLFGDIPDEEYLKAWFKQTGYDLNLENPQTFNEKIQRLKLYDRKLIYTTMADKIAAKDYIRKKLGTDEYNIPILGVWDSFDEIDFNKLPEQFVLKCNHDCGGVVLVPDKSKFDKTAARGKLTSSLNRNFFWGGREWVYKNIKPKIFAEVFIGDDLIENKVYTFGGQVRLINVITGRYGDCKKATYNTRWEQMPFTFAFSEIIDYVFKKPAHFGSLLEISAILSKNIPHLRVDFFEANGKLYLGELTFYHQSGVDSFIPDEWDHELGKWIDLQFL